MTVYSTPNRRQSCSIFLFFSIFTFVSAQGPPPSAIGEKENPPKEQYFDPPQGAPDPKRVADKIKKINEHEFELEGIYFNKQSREIRFPGSVLQNRAQLEFLVVNDFGGKVHESLLGTPISPLLLQVVFKLLRYEQSERDLWPEYDEDGNVLPMKVDDKGQVQIEIERKDADGKKQRFPIEDWVVKLTIDQPDGTPMEKDSWILTGSFMWEGIFVAESEGSIAAVYRSGTALLNSFAKGSDNDEIWLPHPEKVPDIDTEVTIIISPRKKPKTEAQN